MQVHIVLGTSYGDEGKGVFTDWLARRPDPENALVVRFNGGSQAGHTVTLPNGTKHVFSHFGSGTLAGIHNFWSKFCPIDPFSLVAEMEETEANSTWIDRISIDPLCPVTTLWDKWYNQQQEFNLQHGSVGVGFGATIKRHEESQYRLYARDLQLPTDLLYFKLKAIAQYYDITLPEQSDYIDKFLSIAKTLQLQFSLYPWKDIFLHDHSTLIFEGAQGILLDQDHGFFPHVTRSNTTSKNVWQLLSERPNLDWNAEVHYITRTYTTRHGNGPLLNEGKFLPLKNIENETNVQGPWQGIFRKAPLDLRMLDYTMQIDQSYWPSNHSIRYDRVLTCIDQIGDEGMSYVGYNNHLYTHQPFDTFNGQYWHRLSFRHLFNGPTHEHHRFNTY